jgi:hypothetical protein
MRLILAIEFIAQWNAFPAERATFVNSAALLDPRPVGL